MYSGLRTHRSVNYNYLKKSKVDLQTDHICVGKSHVSCLLVRESCQYRVSLGCVAPRGPKNYETKNEGIRDTGKTNTVHYSPTGDGVLTRTDSTNTYQTRWIYS